MPVFVVSLPPNLEQPNHLPVEKPSTFAGTGPTFPRIALETVTMVRSDLSKVVTDQKHDEQFFHEGSHV